MVKKEKKINLNTLLPHESVNKKRVQRLARDIKRNGLKYPIIVARWGKKYFIVDGHHRVEAFRRLNKSKIDSLVIDYFSPYIKVLDWKTGKEIEKKKVLKALKKPFPPKSTRHVIIYGKKLLHISVLSRLARKLKRN